MVRCGWVSTAALRLIVRVSLSGAVVILVRLMAIGMLRVWWCDSKLIKLSNVGKWKSLEVAVKSLKPGKMSKEEFLAEAKVMHKLQHRHLVQLLAVCTDNEPIYIVTELMSNGAYLDYLRNDNGQTLRLMVLLDMAAQVRENDWEGEG